MRGVKGQSFLEYSVLLIIILAVFLSMQMYIKRGIQGRWKSAVDEFGDQYDPRVANSAASYTLLSNSSTQVTVIPEANGQVTMRQDSTNAVETKAGSTTVGSVSAQP
ncbi:MAG: hypothetical protein HY209_02980 [Candidatus Omnitrophica bacterium]|nr:hypothetical protein [Candidatus Omnitrophota bacterium]